jgi:hypothetical protein
MHMPAKLAVNEYILPMVERHDKQYVNCIDSEKETVQFGGSTKQHG